MTNKKRAFRLGGVEKNGTNREREFVVMLSMVENNGKIVVYFFGNAREFVFFRVLIKKYICKGIFVIIHVSILCF